MMNEPPADSSASTLAQRTRFGNAYLVLEQAIRDHVFPGAAFGVLSGGQVLALDAIGRFTYDPEATAVAPGTIYDMASLTKIVATTSAAMLLYDRGRLDLDQPLGEILPGFLIPVQASVGRRRVTMRMLLAHSSGLPAYSRLFETSRTPYDLLQTCLRMPLDATPGSRVEYSDIGFILLGKALEVLCHEPLDQFCAREIFSPLTLASTAYRPSLALHFAIPPTENDTTFRHRVIQGEVHDENCFALGGVSGHAGIFSDVPDLLRFAECIAAHGQTSTGHQLFQSETVKLFATRQQTPHGTLRALGWDTPSGESSSGRFFSGHSIGHLGYTGTSLWIDLEHHLAVALLTNRTWPDRASQAIRAVRPAFHDAIFQAL